MHTHRLLKICVRKFLEMFTRRTSTSNGLGSPPICAVYLWVNVLALLDRPPRASLLEAVAELTERTTGY